MFSAHPQNKREITNEQARVQFPIEGYCLTYIAITMYLLHKKRLRGPVFDEYL